jgi:hypothetical protein
MSKQAVAESDEDEERFQDVDRVAEPNADEPGKKPD